MNFRRGRGRDEPEINFIPLIDVLLVILIFLMVTTTYSRFSEMQINLPTAAGEAPQQKSTQINVALAADGQLAIGNKKLPDAHRATLVAALRAAADGRPSPVVVINADGKATHQSVVNVMEASREAGLTQLTFATQMETP